jgi:hypothetical protein
VSFRSVFIVPGTPLRRVVFESDFAFQRGRLLLDDDEVAHADSRRALEDGLCSSAGNSGGLNLCAHLEMKGAVPTVVVTCDGAPLPAEEELRPSPSRSAWIHAFIALAGSVAGFTASLIYLERAQAVDSTHAFKMAYHMAGWHLLLVLTLFPASVWGQRLGIRSVQVVSLMFFCIHAGIALANATNPIPADPTEFRIAVWNAVSGLFFAIATVYGQRAWRDMNPLRAIEQPSPR